MSRAKRWVFLSYSSEAAFEASLLQYAIEQIFADLNVGIWTYERDQARDEPNIGESLKQRVAESSAFIFLVSPSTSNWGATQWMELAYAHAFGLPRFVMLHRITYAELRSRPEGVPPVLIESQCNPAIEWKRVVEALRSRLAEAQS